MLRHLYNSLFSCCQFPCNDRKQYAGKYRDKGSGDAGGKGCGGINRAVLTAVSDDINRNQLQGGNVDNQKGAHIRTGTGCIFFRVECSKFLHCFQTEGRGCPAQSEKVGNQVGHNILSCRMVFWDIGKKNPEQRVKQLFQAGDDAGRTGNGHKSGPECHDAEHTDAERNGILGRFQERGVYLSDGSVNATVDKTEEQHTCPEKI